MKLKTCSFCQKPAPHHQQTCRTCGQRFPLEKLKFGTKSECIQKAVFWTAINFTVPPLCMLAFWFFRHQDVLIAFKYFPIALIVWFMFVLLIIVFRWLLSDGDSISDVQNRSIQVTGFERYNYIALEFWVQIVMKPFNKMMDAWIDVGRHYD